MVFGPLTPAVQAAAEPPAAIVTPADAQMALRAEVRIGMHGRYCWSSVGVIRRMGAMLRGSAPPALELAAPAGPALARLGIPIGGRGRDGGRLGPLLGQPLPCVRVGYPPRTVHLGLALVPVLLDAPWMVTGA